MNDKEMYSKLYDIFMENSRKMSDDTYIFNKEILLAGYGTAPDEIDVSRLLEIDINDLRYDAYVVATLAPPYIKETSATTKEEIIRELWDSRQMCHRYARFINNPYFKTKIRPIQTFYSVARDVIYSRRFKVFVSSLPGDMKTFLKKHFKRNSK